MSCFLTHQHKRAPHSYLIISSTHWESLRPYFFNSNKVSLRSLKTLGCQSHWQFFLPLGPRIMLCLKISTAFLEISKTDLNTINRTSKLAFNFFFNFRSLFVS